ncbi:aminopeptidase N-like, partial [Nylanderia fulva]|uniref:aminopeptidase N-like n=1 Tax=Nylanderia fulva TaxID=613905 RepID=UPI0010FAF629
MIFNMQQIGYYRVNYDDENWRRITNYLNSVNYMNIHVLNRAQIIDDTFHLMIAGQLNSSIFWNITFYLHQEEDYIAWYPMFKALEHMFNTFPVELSEQKVVIKIRNILNSVLRRFNYQEIDASDDLRKCLRQEAARWACFLGDFTCKKHANNILKQHIIKPKTHRFLPWWKEWTYCKGLMMITTKNEIFWQSVYYIGWKKKDTKFLEYLACPEDTDVITNYLRYIHKSTEQEYQYLCNSFLYIITKHAKNQIILKYILDHFNDIKPKHVGINAAL